MRQSHAAADAVVRVMSFICQLNQARPGVLARYGLAHGAGAVYLFGLARVWRCAPPQLFCPQATTAQALARGQAGVVYRDLVSAFADAPAGALAAVTQARCHHCPAAILLAGFDVDNVAAHADSLFYRSKLSTEMALPAIKCLQAISMQWLRTMAPARCQWL